MSVYDGKYTEKSVTDKSFERNKDFLKPPRAADGEAANTPLDPSLKYSSGNGSKSFDPDLKYSGGNDGFTGKGKSWQ
jgi:hypothetical protein